MQEELFAYYNTEVTALTVAYMVLFLVKLIFIVELNLKTNRIKGKTSDIGEMRREMAGF